MNISFGKINQIINNFAILVVNVLRNTLGNIDFYSILSVMSESDDEDKIVISYNDAVNFNEVFNKIKPIQMGLIMDNC